ncbi:MAG: toll/interleukin-1 receptor domain-containing protein, partial [Planctomycetaceae bacterium]|nr:toll/interleukin-1 receptor domain-containing protein [Planctomycetaceae bacterium]
MNTSFDWDVFLSHSSVESEKPGVARLAERLRAAGFRVWFDRPSIDSGEDIVTAIEQGLERSRVLVMCMTKAAFESEWVRLERNTATFRDPGNHDRRLVFPLCQELSPCPTFARFASSSPRRGIWRWSGRRS